MTLRMFKQMTAGFLSMIMIIVMSALGTGAAITGCNLLDKKVEIQQVDDIALLVEGAPLDIIFKANLSEQEQNTLKSAVFVSQGFLANWRQELASGRVEWLHDSQFWTHFNEIWQAHAAAVLIVADHINEYTPEQKDHIYKYGLAAKEALDQIASYKSQGLSRRAVTITKDFITLALKFVTIL